MAVKRYVKRIPLEDTRQKFWQLALIQGSSMGLPVLLVGGHIASKYGAITAFVSILIGNLILWLIGFGLITMTRRHESAVENVGNYLGKTSKYIAAFVLTLAFIGWFTLQTKFVTKLIGQMFDWPASLQVRVGSGIGFFTALLVMGRIKLIKWVCCICFPFILSVVVFLLIKQGTFNLNEMPTLSFNISISSIIITIISILPGVVNLPTFFRHAKSRVHSISGLTTTIIINAFFQSSTIFLGISSIADLTALNFNKYLILTFAIVTLICINLVNIYYASAAWEIFTHHGAGFRSLAIFGLIGTMFFCTLQADRPIYFVENLVNTYIANLGVALIMSFLLDYLIVHRHKSKKYSIAIGNVSWFVGSFVSTLIMLQKPESSIQAISLGLFSTLMASLLVIFFAESVWGLKRVYFRR